MVWIHGGGFMNGAAYQYIPSRLVTDAGVIVVTIQYRLAAFGFLSSGDGALPAGSASVAALSLTPGANGLFTKAILQSGTMLSAWAMARDPRQTFWDFAKRAGCLPSIYNPWNILAYHQSATNCLRKKTSQELVDAHPRYDLDSIVLDKSFWEQAYLGVVVDKDFLPKSTEELLSDKAYLQQNGVLDRSYMMGMTDNEGILAVLSVPEKFYGNLTSGSNMAGLIRSVVRGKFNLPVETEALNVVDFVYTFPRDNDGKIPLQLKDPNSPIRGTNHGMDLFHEFDGFSNDGFEMLSFYADRDPVKFPIISNIFRGYLTQFAKTGSPVPGSPSAWPRYDTQREQYLAISSEPEVRERLFAQRVSLWTDFLPKAAVSSWFGRSSSTRVAFRD
ncbi:carboxylic ester hydrolase [Elysia marginata]|uniref:Carboxylic ester hydrolase n=1 Tax=Elysia marginata TaxID=1093978 RepID=A0AAV4ILQ1_9GAST|nr:carboxylic ester hydrolase [Elysia marginata]